MTTADLLESAAVVALIAHTKHTMASDEWGNIVHTLSPAACRFCALGLLHAASKGKRELALNALYAVTSSLHEQSLVNWNDAYGRKSIDVYKLFMRVADELRAESLS